MPHKSDDERKTVLKALAMKNAAESKSKKKLHEARVDFEKHETARLLGKHHTPDSMMYDPKLLATRRPSAAIESRQAFNRMIEETRPAKARYMDVLEQYYELPRRKPLLVTLEQYKAKTKGHA